MVMSPAAPDFFVVIFRVGADAGARAIGATADAAANEPRGRRRRHPGSKAVLTGAAACSRSDISGWRAGVLYPLAGGGRESGAAHLDLQTDPHPPPGRCSGGRPHDGDVAGGADSIFVIFRFGADDAAAVELRGRRRRPPACSLSDINRRRALSPTFPAGEMVFFIPWRVVAENPARRISTCRLTRTRRLGGAAAAGRTMVMSPATPDSFAVIFRFGADDAAAVELRGRRRRQP